MRTETWTLEKIRVGFDRFMDEHGRLPTALEIDQLKYLPSSRWIQIKYGGLEKLRKELGYEHAHYGRGVFRSNIAHRVNKRGRDAELSLEVVLRATFGEVFVHSEKIFDTSKNRVDFYVYTPDGNFGIDIFYSENMQSLQSNVNIKMSKYKNFSAKLYFLSANASFRQAELNDYVAAKVNRLPKNIQLVTWETMVSIIKNKKIYANPLNSL